MSVIHLWLRETMSSWREIEVDGKTYKWRCGKTAVRIKGIGYVMLSEITGLAQDIIDRGRHKITSDGMITPKQVAAYIRKVT